MTDVDFERYIRPMCVGECWRVVETQEIAATMSITSTSNDQARLEQLLDSVKPPVPESCEGLSYLLFTPFRYPPLEYGSRYGSTWERGIFYGSRKLETALAETAVYFWLFQQGLKTLGPLGEIHDQRTAFSVRLSSDKAIDLTSAPFSTLQDELTNPHSWDATQKIGSNLRSKNTDFVLYPSARIHGHTNVAVISDNAFMDAVPNITQQWHCKLTQHSCIFARAEARSVEFIKKDFEVDGRIPHPAL